MLLLRLFVKLNMFWMFSFWLNKFIEKSELMIRNPQLLSEVIESFLNFFFSAFHRNLFWWAIIWWIKILIYSYLNMYFKHSNMYYEYVTMYWAHVMIYYEYISMYCKHVIMYCAHINIHYECIGMYCLYVIIHYEYITMYRAHVTIHYKFLNTNYAHPNRFYRPEISNSPEFFKLTKHP